MKYGMNMLLWTTDVNETHLPLLESIKQWGYDGVELPIFDMNDAKFGMIGKALDNIGLERTAVTVSSKETNPISDSPVVRLAARDNLKRAIDMCHMAGVKLLCGPMHSPLGHFTGAGPTHSEWQWGRDVFREVGPYAKDAEVMLALEALNRFECYFLNSMQQLAEFCAEVDHPNVQGMYDTFHANIEEKNVAAAIRAIKPHLVHVHICENDRSTPGEGQVNWIHTFEMLSQIQYDGWWTIEAFGMAMPELAAATKIWRRMFPSEKHLATRGLEFMQNMWQKG